MNISKTKKIIITISLLTSCMTIPTQNYFVENKNNLKLNINKSLKIQLFQDFRKGENTDKTGLIFVPFLKSAGAELNFPEADRMSINSPIKYYIADILKLELENEYNFKNLYISDEKNNSADYVISGKINTFFCSRKFYTYWLGLFGPLTWYFGLPVMGNECNLNIDITLQNKSGKYLFSKIYVEESLIYSGLYYNLVDLSLVFPDITKKLMTKVLEDFRPFLKN
ncbi:hypothetical protein EHQ94_00015 [Leptospira meyeri]|uniref:hypothetical protein n=1 Tax=Leptospira meyeri TaxID=29508 RepID=UPI0010841BCF|nr:hypothetical protein [Leptospira meyeri]TGM60093.1 hypothetical protein EHQ93_18035 [Leptospira meyeri]TGM74361.1 hypothetical protein EHQ94_00015 [Leptospira meyeri]